MTNGFDASMMNGLQSLSQWEDAFNHPVGGTLGLLNAIQVSKSIAAVSHPSQQLFRISALLVHIHFRPMCRTELAGDQRSFWELSSCVVRLRFLLSFPSISVLNSNKRCYGFANCI